MVTVKDLSVCFNDRLMNLTRHFDEVIVAFDTYRADSLKNRTRQKRRKGKDPVQYQVRDETSIRHITLSRFLSHDQTKANLTEYLAQKILDYNKDSPKLIITSAAGHTRSNRDVGPFPDNNHEEADTLMICLGVSATERNSVDAQMTFFSPDTDFLVLIIANYDRLPKNTSISMASRVQQIEPLWAALGPDRAKALPGLHAFSGADNTGRFARISKPTWFKLFMEAEDDVIEALCTLCDDADMSEDFQLTLAQFVCTAYCPTTGQLHMAENSFTRTTYVSPFKANTSANWNAVSCQTWRGCHTSVDSGVTFGRLAVSDSELGVDVIDFDECYCYLFTVLYCSLVLHAGPF